MKRKRLHFAALALLAVAAVVAAYLLIAENSSELTTMLPDGSTFTLRRITTGTRHRYDSGNFLQRTAGRILPERWAKKFGAQAVTYTSTNVTHVVWLERVGPSNAIRGVGFPSITNDAGFDRSYQAAAQLFTPGRYVQGFLLDACPTDSRRICVTIRLMPFPRMPDVCFNASNPDFVRRRKWVARPCPVEAAQGGLSVCLERFTTQARNPTTAPGVPWTELSFVIQDHAAPTNNWFARSVRILNQAGSEFLQPVYPTEALGSRNYATFPGGLSSAEPYKLRFELRRTFCGSNELRTIEVIAQPSRGP